MVGVRVRASRPARFHSSTDPHPDRTRSRNFAATHSRVVVSYGGISPQTSSSSARSRAIISASGIDRLSHVALRTALAASDVSDAKAAAFGIRLHELVELPPLACDQELRRSVVETLALQLPDRGAQFENLGAQLQDPVGIRVFVHRTLPMS